MDIDGFGSLWENRIFISENMRLQNVLQITYHLIVAQRIERISIPLVISMLVMTRWLDPNFATLNSSDPHLRFQLTMTTFELKCLHHCSSMTMYSHDSCSTSNPVILNWLGPSETLKKESSKTLDFPNKNEKLWKFYLVATVFDSMCHDAYLMKANY